MSEEYLISNRSAFVVMLVASHVKRQQRIAPTRYESVSSDAL